MTQCGIHGSMEYVKQLEEQNAALRARVKHCEMCGGEWYDGGLNSRCCCVDVKKLTGAHEESVRQVEELENRLSTLRARNALLEKVAEEYRFALIFYAAQANYIVAGEGMNWVIADQGARARAALDALKEG